MGMRKLMTLVFLMALPASAATAHWTGGMEFVTTVTFQPGIRCEYDYLGQRFWRIFLRRTCPMRIDVE